jgi:hypothetical protein
MAPTDGKDGRGKERFVGVARADAAIAATLGEGLAPVAPAPGVAEEQIRARTQGRASLRLAEGA